VATRDEVDLKALINALGLRQSEERVRLHDTFDKHLDQAHPGQQIAYSGNKSQTRTYSGPMPRTRTRADAHALAHIEDARTVAKNPHFASWFQLGSYKPAAWPVAKKVLSTLLQRWRARELLYENKTGERQRTTEQRRIDQAALELVHDTLHAMAHRGAACWTTAPTPSWVRVRADSDYIGDLGLLMSHALDVHEGKIKAIVVLVPRMLSHVDETASELYLDRDGSQQLRFPRRHFNARMSLKGLTAAGWTLVHDPNHITDWRPTSIKDHNGDMIALLYGRPDGTDDEHTFAWLDIAHTNRGDLELCAPPTLAELLDFKPWRLRWALQAPEARARFDQITRAISPSNAWTPSLGERVRVLTGELAPAIGRVRDVNHDSKVAHIQLTDEQQLANVMADVPFADLDRHLGVGDAVSLQQDGIVFNGIVARILPATQASSARDRKRQVVLVMDAKTGAQVRRSNAGVQLRSNTNARLRHTVARVSVTQNAKLRRCRCRCGLCRTALNVSCLHRRQRLRHSMHQCPQSRG
jgi:hypothetical protein